MKKNNVEIKELTSLVELSQEEQNNIKGGKGDFIGDLLGTVF